MRDKQKYYVRDLRSTPVELCQIQLLVLSLFLFTWAEPRTGTILLRTLNY